MAIASMLMAAVFGASLAAAPAGSPFESPLSVSFEELGERLPSMPQQEALFEGLMQKRATQALARLDAATTDRDRFYALPDAARAAFHLKRYPLAAELAARTLEASASFPKDWNYGNAIHAAHTVMGLLALNDGDRRRAVAELHEAGATPGSPQLGSFGPSMSLARALLDAGESAEVIGYLEQCRVFWQSGGTWIAVWEEKIRAGQVPSFFMHRW